MKKAFSKAWKASKQPRKQRKYNYNLPLHLKHSMLSAHLSKDLRKKYGRRAFPVKKGDKVKIMRGQYAGKDGKIDRVDQKLSKVYIPGIERAKKDGSKSLYPLTPSNLMIVELDTSDNKRKEALSKDSVKQTPAKPAAKN
jgi:large subunit ribosomal protein L24